LFPINCLCLSHKVKKHLVGPTSSDIAGFPALRAKIILRTHQKTAELQREKSTQNREKKQKKTFAMEYVTVDIC